MRKIKFKCTSPDGDRRHYLDEGNVSTMLSRMPEETWERLRAVHFNDRGFGVRILGYVQRGHREISIWALPPRVSLTRFLVKGQTCEEFGAKRGAQWPHLAISNILTRFTTDQTHRVLEGKARQRTSDKTGVPGLRWKPFFALLQGYTRSYLAPPGLIWITQYSVFMIRMGQFALSGCFKYVMGAAGWRVHWLDLRVCRRQGKPWTSGFRLLREKRTRSGDA